MVIPYKAPSMLYRCMHELAFEVNNLIGYADIKHRLKDKPKLFFEFNSVRDMHGFITQLKDECDRSLPFEFEDFYKYIDDETVEIPYGPVSLVITCKESFLTSDKRVAKYCNINFVQYVPLEFPKPPEDLSS